MTRGVVLIVYGERAEQASQRALNALVDVCPELPVTVYHARAQGFDDAQQSRYAKVTLLDWSPYDHTVYLDADTQVYQPIDAGFVALENGFDLVLTPSQNQTDNFLWHCGEADKAATLREVGYQPLQLQAGVMFVARNDRTRRLFARWLAEWLRFENQDQGALLRAFYQHPVKVWLLGSPWNGGAVIGHHWGAIRKGISND